MQSLFIRTIGSTSSDNRMRKVVLAGSNGQPYPTLKSVIENTADVVLFGDSVLERVSRHDEDRRTLGQMVTENLAPRSVLTLSRSAHNPDIYLPLLRVMAKMRHRPDSIIIPVNLRCFSPQWELSPDWTFDQEKAIITRYLRWRWASIKPVSNVHYDPEKHAEFDKRSVDYELSDFRSIGNFNNIIATEPSRERSAAIFTYHYTHRLSPLNRRLQNLKECSEIARSIARRVLIYVTPINIEAIERFVGMKAIRIVSDNVETVRGALDQANFTSWAGCLSEREFFSEDLATEHLNEMGRREIANRIARSFMD